MQGSIRFASEFPDCRVDGFFHALEIGVDLCSVASWFAVRVLFLGFAVVLGFVILGLVLFFFWIRSFFLIRLRSF